MAASTIFLWLCRCRLHIRLARQTSRRLQREANLTRLRYEDDCCARAALAKGHRQQAAAVKGQRLQTAAVRGKAALARASDKANEPLCRDTAASTASAIASLLVENLSPILEGLLSVRAITSTEAVATVFAAQESATVADERRRNEAAAAAKALAAQALAAALAKDRRCQEVAARAVQASAEALAAESRCQAVATPTRAAQASASVNERRRNDLTVCRRVRPRRRTGRRNRSRAPSPLDEALPSCAPPMCGGGSPLISGVPTLLARESATAGSPPHLEELVRANSPPCLETPSPLLFMTASSSPSLQPFDVTRVVSMLLEGGGAHPFRDRGLPLPPRKRARGRRHPRRVCRRHGPRVPNPLEPLLCGRRHRPRAPNECGGWA